MTADVLANNGIVDRQADLPTMSSPVIPTVPGESSKQIKYVVFITKENHTYDTIFDRIPGANHDPSLLRWGLHQTIAADGQPTLKDVGVMVNHNALARQFTVSDNFYMEPEASGVGHRWLVGVQPNNLMQMTYSVGWTFKNDTTAPGRRYSMAGNGSLMPEDYPEAGSMWEHLARNGIRFRNYGEGFEFPGVEEKENEAPTGAREVINIPMPKVLFDNTCREFPIFNMNIPDQYRAHWFMNDVEKLFLSGQRPFPSFVNIALCNDHGAELKPGQGLSLPRLVHGRQRSGAGPDRRVPVPHALLEEHGDLRDAGRFRRRAGPRGRPAKRAAWSSARGRNAATFRTGTRPSSACTARSTRSSACRR